MMTTTEKFTSCLTLTILYCALSSATSYMILIKVILQSVHYSNYERSMTLIFLCIISFVLTAFYMTYLRLMYVIYRIEIKSKLFYFLILLSAVFQVIFTFTFVAAAFSLELQ